MKITGATGRFAIGALFAWLLLSTCAWAGGMRFEELRYVDRRAWMGDTRQLSISANGTVAIEGVQPNRPALSVSERNKLVQLVAAVDWKHVQPRYEASIDDGDVAQLKISVGGRMYATNVLVVGAAGEPRALASLLLYLELLRRELDPATHPRDPAQPVQAVGATR